MSIEREHLNYRGHLKKNWHNKKLLYILTKYIKIGHREGKND